MMIYLASQSARRKQLLKKMGYSFRVIPSSYRERLIAGMRPRKLVLTHAIGKVKKAAAPPVARWILGADTAVVYRSHVLGKPRNHRDAYRMLALLQGRVHCVYTGVALMDRKSGVWKTAVVSTRVQMKKMNGQVIENYLEKINPLDKAGAYGIQELPRIIERIKGSYTNVVGLPMEVVKEFFQSVKRPVGKIKANL
jgi:septum formation protein